MKIGNIGFLFEENPNPMWVFDPADLTIKQVNDAACDLYGYTREEFLSLTIADLRPEDEIPKLIKEVSKGIDTFSNAGIWKHRKKNGDLLFVRILSYPVSREGKKFELIAAHDVTREFMYQHELQMLLENSADGIMLTSPDGQIHKVNKAACQIFGMSEQQIIDLGRDKLVHDDEKFQTALRKRNQTGEFFGELIFIHSSGRKIPVELTTSVYENPQGQLRTNMIFRDITQRKETQQKLQDIIDHSTNMFYRHDVNHTLTYVSPQVVEFLGCTPDKAKQKWTEFFTEHPINKEGYKITAKAIKTGEMQPPFTLQLLKKTGEKIWVRVHEAPIVENGETVAIVGSLTDITQQKQYEHQLQESLERYSFATKATNDAIYDWDIANDQLHFEEGLNDIFDQKDEKNNFPLKKYSHFVHPDDHPDAQQSLDDTLENSSKTHWNYDYRLKKSDGEYAHVVEDAYIIRNKDGVAVRMIGAIRDVTKQRELETRLNQAYAVGRIGVWEVDLNNDSIYWSTITKEMHEVAPDYEPDFETGITFYKEGNSRAIIKEAVRNAIDDGISWDEELQIVTAKGNTRWVRVKGEPEMVEGQCRRIYGIFQDIHERKQAELDLRRMSRIMKNAQEIAHLGSFEFVVADQTTIWSEEEYRIYSLDPNGPSPEYNVMLEKCIHPDDAKLLHDTFMTAMQNREVYELEHRIVRPDGGVRWVHDKAHPHFDQDGNLLRYVGATLDITDRKQNQIELERAYKEKVTILESIDDGFFTINWDWIVTYWNTAAERMLETSRETIVGYKLWDVFEDATGLPSYTNYHRVMNEKISVDFEDYYAPLDRWYDISAYPSKNGVSVYFKDITQQKQKETQLQDSLKEKETMLSEIHHRVKNNLAVVSSMMMLQTFQEDDEALKEKLNNGVSRIKTIGNIHELLYRSDSFSRLKFDKNIKKLVNDIALTYQSAISLEINFDLQEIDLNINQAIPASLIVNEVVTNVFKHAFNEDENGKLWVAMSNINDTIRLQVTDNGKGLPADFKVTDSAVTMGLQLIDTLTHQLGGDNTYESADGKTHFNLIFDKKDVKGSGSYSIR